MSAEPRIAAPVREPHAGALPVAELEGAMREFSAIGSKLVESYEALARRAARVEEELGRTNRELQHKLRELEAILQALPTGVVVRDAEGRVATANGAALRILGGPPGELALDAGDPRHALLAAPDPETAAAGGEELHELRRPNGRRLVVATRHAPIGAADAGQGSVTILDDRTEIRALAEQVHTMDKMAALGTMAGGIAHEIRNPLTAIQGFAALLRGELPEGSQAHRWASLIVAGAEETETIVASMLTFARPEPLVLESVDGEALLADALRLALPEGPPDPRLAVAARCGAPLFAGDRIKLRQAVRNLVCNALQAQEGQGEARVEVTLEREGGEIVFRVADAGPGIPPDCRERVLDPFYTTRAEGSGLGLALTSSVARLHGGSLQVDPEPGPLGGALLSIRFPFQPIPPHPAR